MNLASVMPILQSPVNRGFAGFGNGNARKAATGFRRLPLFCRLPLANTRVLGSRLEVSAGIRRA
jgi:hypothetical protein